MAAWLAVAASADRARARDEDLFVRPEDQRVVFFGSLDAGRSTFVSGGLKQTLTGPLDRPGFVAMEQVGFGVTRERFERGGASASVMRYSTDGSATFGYQWTSPFYLAALVGPEVKSEQLTLAGRFERVSKPRIGARAQVELWANPTPDTLLTGTLVAGSARTSVWARVSAGYRLFGKVFVGPEATIYTTPTYSELRWGGHVTGLSLGILQLRVSGGVTHDDGRRGVSPYAGISAWLRL